MKRSKRFTPRPRAADANAAFTIIELLVALSIIAILALALLPNVLIFQTRAKVSASRNNQRILTQGIEMYRIDQGEYPVPARSTADPFGVVSRHALRRLTTPIAYIGADAFHDPFGTLRIQVPAVRASSFTDDPLRPPTPGIKTDRSSLYFHYPYLAELLNREFPTQNGFAVVSVGPDLKDSFIVYYPFPETLPPRAALYGIRTIADTVYDPTNGAISGGDMAAFGGDLAVPPFVGGGR